MKHTKILYINTNMFYKYVINVRNMLPG